MKIVHYIGVVRLSLGGVVRAVLDICEALADEGHDVTLVTSCAADVPLEWRRDSERPNVVELRASGSLFAPFSEPQLRVLGELVRVADAVHFHELWNPAIRQLARVCSGLRVPYVITLHGVLDDWCMRQKRLKKRAYLALAARSLLEDAQAVHCTAEAEAEQASKWIYRGRVVVVPLIFDMTPFHELPGPGVARAAYPSLAADNRTLILFLSRLHEKKQVHRLIESAKILRDGGCSFILALAGTGEVGYVQRLRAMVKARALEDCVVFLGFVAGIEKISLLQAADLLVLPTRQENWGFVLVEALAAGTPVITTTGVDIWGELERSGGAAISDPEDNPLADTIRSLVDNPQRRESMGRAGRSWILARFDRRGVIRQYESLYSGH